jgi:hypothetical protein
VEREQPEVDQRTGRRLAAGRHQVLLRQMPAARPDQQGRGPLAERVVPAVGGLVGDGPAYGVDQVGLPLDLVAPGGTVGVLEVGHEPLRARVERVDHQLAVGRTGDLHPAVGVVGPGRRHPPVAAADVGGLRQEVGRRRAGPAGRDQLPPAGVEPVVQFAEERQRLGGQYLGAAALAQVGVVDGAQRHGATPRIDASSRVIGW